MVALAVGFTSCEDTSDLGIVQTNEQLPMIASDCATIAPGTSLSDAEWDIPALEAANKLTLDVAKTTDTKGLQENAKITYGFEFAADNTFKDAVAKEIGNDGVLGIDELDDIFREVFGMGPKPQTLWMRAQAYVNVGAEKFIVGDNTTRWQFVKSIVVTPIPKPMDEHYYFLSGATNWDLGQSSAIEMSYEQGVNIYDNPYFWIVIDAPADCYWKIAGQTAMDEQAATGNGWGMVLGGTVDGDDAQTGTLISENAQAYKIKDAGKYIVRINAMERTFSVAPATEALWTPGGGLNNWDIAASFPVPTNDFVNYSGYSYVGSEFKFSPYPNWNHGDYGKGAEDNMMAWRSNSGNISPLETGFVHINVSTGTCKFDIKPVGEFAMIGGFNNWGGSLYMTHDEKWQIWTAEVTCTSMQDGKNEFKFRNGENWDFNLGEYVDGNGVTHLVNNGGNLKFPAVGTYVVTLNLSTVPYSYTITAK